MDYILEEYACPYCSFSSSSITSLKAHFQRHDVEPYKCVLCGYKCRYRIALNRHYLMKHIRKSQFRALEIDQRGEENLKFVNESDVTDESVGVDEEVEVVDFEIEYVVKETTLEKEETILEDIETAVKDEESCLLTEETDLVTEALFSETNWNYQVDFQNNINNYENEENVELYSHTLDFVTVSYDDDLSHRCTICECRLQNRRDLRKHMKTHPKKYCCITCKSKVRSHKLLLEHMQVVHGRDVYKCAHCEVVFLNKAELVSHVGTHIAETSYACSRCFCKFKWKYCLDRHVKEMHSSKRKSFEYVLSDRKFEWKYRLVRPIQNHTEEHEKKIMHCCRLCDKKFCVKSSLNRHMKIHDIKKDDLWHTEKPFHCSICGSTFLYEKNLRRHSKLHTCTEEMRYCCSVCERKFREEINLVRHLRIHSNEKPFSCADCHFRFRQKGALIRHTRIHTKEKPYSCTKCKKRFNRKESKDYHMKLHERFSDVEENICANGLTDHSKRED